jgi:tRNA pseudouridine38-40 synthase
MEQNSIIELDNKTEILEEKKTEEGEKINTLKKVQHPKRKYAIIHGYFGHHFSGNQKNPDVRTVEEEMEKTFFKLDFISECNFGTLQKISWSRASRTDKKVSAIMNVVSCKLHKFLSDEEMKKVCNEALPKDIKIFRFIEVSRNFDSKESNNNREYHYILPSFMLQPKTEILDYPGKTELNNYIGDYKYTLSPEFHEKIKELCRLFKGTKKYHNYTKKLNHSDASSARHLYEFSCQEIIKYKEFEAIKFKIVGQSFLYNQIRKMIGSIIECCRENRGAQYIENSFLANKIDIPKAPAEGLYLHKIDYSKYNDRKQTKKNPIDLTETEEAEMEQYRLQLVEEIEKCEIKEKVFSQWLWKFDHNREAVCK